MAEFISLFKYEKERNNDNRKELLEKGPDSIELPSSCHGTLVSYYWQQKTVDGITTSILHPLIREELVGVSTVYNVDQSFCRF